VEVEVVETSRKGDGVAKVNGFIIFVPNTKPGDKVRVKISKVGRSYAVGEVSSEEPTVNAGSPQADEDEEDDEEEEE
jgi:predicted RNA-binding protein with TRAM domain